MSIVKEKITRHDTVIRNAISSRIELMTDLLERLQIYRANSPREDFSKLINYSASVLELEERELSELLKASKPTINRWIRGESVPSKSLREPIFRALSKIANRKLSLLRKSDKNFPKQGHRNSVLERKAE